MTTAITILGNDVEFEKKRLAAVNIIICTPGRLLQHMDENEHFTCDQLQMLVIDESDRILDMGFRAQVWRLRPWWFQCIMLVVLGGRNPRESPHGTADTSPLSDSNTTRGRPCKSLTLRPSVRFA